jgi:hypothetical protein
VSPHAFSQHRVGGGARLELPGTVVALDIEAQFQSLAVQGIDAEHDIPLVRAVLHDGVDGLRRPGRVHLDGSGLHDLIAVPD